MASMKGIRGVAARKNTEGAEREFEGAVSSPVRERVLSPTTGETMETSWAPSTDTQQKREAADAASRLITIARHPRLPVNPTEKSMSFVYRAFTDADLEYVVSKGAGPHFASVPSRWVDDQVRDLQLLSWGGKGDTSDRENDPPDFHLLLAQGRPVSFQAWRKSELTAGTWTHALEVTAIAAPVGLEREPLENFIREGLTALYEGMSTRPVQAVQVEFTDRRAGTN